MLTTLTTEERASVQNTLRGILLDKLQATFDQIVVQAASNALDELTDKELIQTAMANRINFPTENSLS